MQPRGHRGVVPKRARLYAFPTVEHWGLVWAYYGVNEKPVFELPNFPIAAPAYRTYGTLKFKLDISLQIANSVDYQHLVALHGLTMEKYPEVTFERYHMNQTGVVFTDHRRMGGARLAIDVAIHGSNILLFGGEVAGQEAHFAVAGTPVIAEGVSYGYTVMAAPSESMEPAAMEQYLLGLEKWSHALMVDDDQPIFDAISFRQDALLPQDKYFAQYLRYLEKYPRVHPAEDFIK